MKSSKSLPVYLWALSYFKPYIWILISLVLCGITVTGIQLFIPKGVQYFIDNIIPTGNTDVFWLLIIGTSLALLIMFGVMAIRNLLQRSIQEKAAKDVQFDIFKHLRRLGFSYFEQRPIGESLSFMNTEVTALQNLYRRLFPWMLQSLLFVSISVSLMISVSLRLTLIMIPCLLLYYLIGPYFEKRATSVAEKVTTTRLTFYQKSYESVASLSELRAYHAEEWDKKQFKGKLQSYLDTRVRMNWFSYMRGTIRRLTYYIGGIAVIFYGIVLVQKGLLSVGAMVAFLLYYFQTMHTLTSVITSITEQKMLVIQAQKIYQFMNIEPEIKEIDHPTSIRHVQGEIGFHNVGFEYTNGKQVLNHFNLHIKPGEKVALVGTSGSGKSTALKLMVRFYDVTKGKITLDGVPIQKMFFSQLRESIGYVFQETYLFGASVKENILFGRPDASMEEVIVAAKAANAHHFIQQLPDGYDTLLGERGVKLSGGQKQRISIARMFIKNPAVVLLDEATSALDNVSEQEVQVALERLLQGKTTITVAHRLSTIYDYDRIVVMENGAIIEEGIHHELIQAQGKYYQMTMGEKERPIS